MEPRILRKVMVLAVALAGIAAGAQAPPLIYSAVIGTSTTPNTLTLVGTDFAPVSYTHLDVYKRQVLERPNHYPITSHSVVARTNADFPICTICT